MTASRACASDVDLLNSLGEHRDLLYSTYDWSLPFFRILNTDMETIELYRTHIGTSQSPTSLK